MGKIMKSAILAFLGLIKTTLSLLSFSSGLYLPCHVQSFITHSLPVFIMVKSLCRSVLSNVQLWVLFSCFK